MEYTKKKRLYLKIHVAVNVKTKEILALEVTDEKVHDSSKMLKKQVNHVLKINPHHHYHYHKTNKIRPG